MTCYVYPGLNSEMSLAQACYRLGLRPFEVRNPNKSNHNWHRRRIERRMLMLYQLHKGLTYEAVGKNFYRGHDTILHHVKAHLGQCKYDKLAFNKSRLIAKKLGFDKVFVKMVEQEKLIRVSN
jgi:hypothetical protein